MLNRRPRPSFLLLPFAFFLLCTRLAHAAPEPPPVATAVALNTTALQPGQQAVLAVVFNIRPGFHIQSHSAPDREIALMVALSPSPQIVAYEPRYPAGEAVELPSLGKISINSGRAIVHVPFQVKSDAIPGPVRLAGSVTYQACNDKGLCDLPVEDAPFTIDTTITPPGAAIQPNRPDLFATFDFSSFAGLKPAVATTSLGLFGWKLADNAYLPAFAVALLVGLIFNLMPCVLPVVPLKAMSFYEISQHHRGRSLLLGAVFSLGIVATFAILAVLVVVSRTLAWGDQFSNPWFLAAIIAILVTMALSMFGVFSVVLPTGIYSFAPRHDTLTGNYLFGILTAVLSTPCTAPMFVGLLLWATRQPPALGVAVVMTVGIGMALPYMVLSAFPELARRFPRTGPWSQVVKQLMGFLLLGVALYFARPFISRFLGEKGFWWTLLTIVAAAGGFLVIRAIQLSPRLLPRAIAAAVALILIVPATAFAIRLTHSPIAWQPYTPETLAAARASGRPVFLEFTATWCTNCQVLEATVFHDPQVVAAIKQHNVIPIRVDITAAASPGRQLLTRINQVGGVPLTVISSPALKDPIQISGVYTASHLLDALTEASGQQAALP